MSFTQELELVLKILLAFMLGAFIGFERERDGISAGIRTYAAVCLGSTLFTDIGENLGNLEASSRIISNIITGIGFLGAGIIYKNEKTNSSHGLTTAATIWCTAGIGVAVGLEMYIISIVATAAIYFLLALQNFSWYRKWRKDITDMDDHSATED